MSKLDETPDSQFSLTRQFMVAAAFVVLSGMAAVGIWVTRTIEESIKEHAAAVTALHVDAIVAPLALKLLTQPALSAEDRIAFDARLNRGVINRDLFAFKLWTPEGRIVYASDPDLIGQRFERTVALADALSGNIHAEFDQLDNNESASEKRAGVPLLEIYSPIFNPETGEIAGVVEFYEAATRLRDELSSARQRTWIVVGVLTAGMLALLYGIVARGGRLIASQREVLAEKISTLSALLEQNKALKLHADSANQRATALNERYLRRISSELHDGPLQLLGFASLRIGSHKLKGEAVEIRDALDGAIQEIRNISRGLTLPEIEGLGTADTIRRAVASHEILHGTSVELDLADLPDRTQAERICIYRFVREGLTNAHRHADASRISVSASDQDGEFVVVVTDNGVGFDFAASHDGLGLPGLRERVAGLGGSLTIDSGPGAGTRLTMRLSTGASP